MDEKIKQKSIKELLEFSILNIDKPSGPTSFDVSDFVREKLGKFGVKKTSHFGTLDPKVTGVLPIALNRACKLTGFFLGHDKEYVGIMRIHEEVDLEKIKKIIKDKFLGKIKQTPPVKSRVKRQEREREIKKFEILEKDENGKDFLFIAEVEGGTYIRKLIDDLGRELGIGAHMLELRRIKAGIFSEEVRGDERFVNLYDIEKIADESNEKELRKVLIPAEEALKKVFPIVEVKNDSIKKLLTGKPVYYNDLKEKINIKEGQLVIMFNDNEFIGVYKIINEKEVFAKPEFVMQPIS